MKPVAIVGGGIAGLSAAHELKKAGIPFVLYEAGSRCGGVIHSIRRDGYLAELGPNSILETSPQIKELIAELGLEKRRVYSDPAAENRYVVRGGRPRLMPATPVGFFTSDLFGIGAKAHLMMEPFVRRGAPDADETIGAFVKRRLGNEFLDYAINPMVAGIYAGDTDRLSVQQAFPKLHALEQRFGSLILGQFLGARERAKTGEVSKQNAPKFSFDEGLRVLIDALQNEFYPQIRFNTAVTAIHANGESWKLTLANFSETSVAEHSCVLLAAPAHRLKGIQFHGHSHLDLLPLGEIEYPPVASVSLGFRRLHVEHPLDGFGMLVPEKEKREVLGTLFCSSLFPNRAPEGHVLITSYVGGARSPGLTELSKEGLVDLVWWDLHDMLGITGPPTFQNVTVFPKAIAQYNIGFGAFREHMDALENAEPGIFLAGHFRDGISLSDSLVSGRRAGDRIMTSLRVEGNAGVTEQNADFAHTN